ncbi:hypothetical protein AAH678_25775 [Sodalis endosymbiont of Spalangia cameroni]|uniref:hypothetical protein n=1 Tax=Sodalis praecaptivus TaxID=1239307 RepID=UPI0031F72D52
MRETSPVTEIDYSEMVKLIELDGTEKKVNDVAGLKDIVDVAISYCCSSDPDKENHYRKQLETLCYCYELAPDGETGQFTKISIANSCLPTIFEKVLTTLDNEKKHNIQTLFKYILVGWPNKGEASKSSSTLRPTTSGNVH